jgi:hypothetical protein
MKRTSSKLLTGAQALVLAALPLAVSQALAAEYWLQTGPATVQGVPMWGYANCTASFASCAPVTVPGPALSIAPADAGLTVHLKNTLGAPTSLVIAGQAITDPTPVWTDGSSGPRGADLTKRVRSFTHEALAGGGTADYAWSNLKPGTYLYQSGTEPQVQVQMGLYGAMTKDADVGNIAYRQGGNSIAYANQVTLLYSEVDPALHQAVASGAYGTTGPTSTLDYHPKFFLINGTPYPDAGLMPVATVAAAQATLLRFLNAGLKTHVPTINGQYWKMIAEDGNPYPYLNNPRQQYTAFLTAGKTMDVLLTPSNPNASGNVRYAIFDSRAYDTNNGAQGGGMLAYLDVTPATAAAPVFDSAPVTTGAAGVAYSYQAHATDPNGDLVSYSLNAPVLAGMTVGTASGLINWTPAAAGSYAVSVRASDGTLFNDQNYTIAVATGVPANHPPVAANDTYTAVAHAASGGAQVVAGPGVLANDTDPDGNPLHTTAATVGGGRVALSANGGFSLTSSTSTTPVTFTYQAIDSAGAPSNTATATINFVANRRPTTVADAFTVPRCMVRVGTSTACQITGTGAYVPTTLNLTNNDTDPDTATIDVANQLPLSVDRLRAGTGTTNVTSGTLTTSNGGRVTFTGSAATGVNVTYTPVYNFAGTDTFQYKVRDRLNLQAGSNGTGAAGWATVTVTVQ